MILIHFHATPGLGQIVEKERCLELVRCMCPTQIKSSREYGDIRLFVTYVHVHDVIRFNFAFTNATESPRNGLARPARSRGEKFGP
jgi:hypothetical protein